MLKKDNKEMLIAPQELYPTESFATIKNDILQVYIKQYENGNIVDKPLVFLFDNNYYILKGHHLVLAAIMSRVKELCVEVVDNKEYSFWNSEENIKENLKSVGMRTLYDFETIGGFTYQTYPLYYK